MKATFVILLVCIINSAYATNYYFSSVSGIDSRTTLEAQDPSTPWKSLNKLNSFFSSLQPGDSVLLKRDEVFYGSIIVKKSGSTTFPIVIGAYGSGNRPVITSLVTLSGWVSRGNGIWESANSLDSIVNLVLLNDVEQEMGRYPNSDAANNGYLTFESHSGETSITDNNLNTSINWAGAELVTRPRHWILNRSLITGQSGHTISYTTNSPYEPFDNYGYFIQNSINTLDKLGEWYYNPATKTLSAYFGSDDPSSYVMQATTMGDLISSSSFSNIVFDNLTVNGANHSGFFINNGSNIHIQNCDILFSGISGALVRGHTNLHVENCTISNSNNNGIDMEFGVKNAVIRNNKILNTALIAGLLQNGEGNGLAIYSNGDGATIESNELRSTGFIGMTFYGSNVTVSNNLIDSFCFVKDDGGGIYSHGETTIPVNRNITGNIVMNGIGAGAGTDHLDKVSTSGIYIDNNTANIAITGNTVTTCFQGIFIQSSNGMNITNNTAFDNARQMTIIQRAGNNTVRNNTITQNNFFSKTSDEYTLYIMSTADDIGSFGTFDNNYYARPVDDNLTIFNSRVAGGNTINENMDLAGWQNKYGQDANSKKSPETISANTANDISQLIKFDYTSNVSKSFSLNDNYLDVTGQEYSDNIVLQPYSSIVLIKFFPKIPPTINITSPDDNADFTASASLNITADANDADGSVTKVDFYNGSTLLGSANTSPYSFTWNNVPAGDYVLTAKATDNDGLVTTSNSVSVSVTTVLLPPVVNMTAPDDNSTYVEPATINMSAAANDADGSISKVDFYNGSTLLNSQQSSPYNFSWQNVPAGNYKLTAVATDNDGLTTTSDIVSVSVTGALSPPVVNITAPGNNSIYTQPATINMSASASDADGSISKVDFYNGSTLLNSRQSSPYNFSWQNVAAGNYKLTAIATDNDGLTTTSDVVSVTVTGALSPPAVNMTAPAGNSTYTAPATITMTAVATDANGTISEVDFYNGSTLLNTQHTSPYTFSWQNVPAGNYNLTAKATDNDGLTTTSGIVSVVVKTVSSPLVINMTAPAINSTYNEPATIIMSAVATDAKGSISKVEFYNGTKLLATEHTSPYTFTWKKVSAGNYALKAKATDNHGLTSTSSVHTVSVVKVTKNKAPTASITTPGNNATYTAPASIKITATAKDADGSISKVEFFNGTKLLTTQHTSPYTYDWNKVPAGKYTITVKATDNKGLATTSAKVNISVKAQHASRDASSQAPSQASEAVSQANNESANMPPGFNDDSQTESSKLLMHSDFSKMLNFQLLPDPAVNTIQIYFDESQTIYQKANLTIYNALGVVIKRYPVIISGRKIGVDISSLSPGMYIIGLSGDNFTLNKKFFKVK